VLTPSKLKTRTVKDLAAMARRKRISGWHSMRKEELVKALALSARREAARAAKAAGRNGRNPAAVACNSGAAGRANGAAKANGADKTNGAENTHAGKAAAARKQRRLEQIKARSAASKDLAFRSVSDKNGCARDRLVVMVLDPYWLHAYWELTRRSVERARVAMGASWHAARPVLRLLEVDRNGTTSSARKFVRDVEIHGGVNNWYVDVQDPPKSYQLEIGYQAGRERFFALARSNVVTTPLAGSSESFDKNWAEVAKDFDRIYAMSGGYTDQETSRELKEVFEEQLRRPMGDPMATQFGLGAAASGGRSRAFNFSVDTELIVHGVAEPDAHVTLRGEPVPVRPDGTFAVRFNLPDRRHVLPVVASSSDGVERHTIVLAVDRNTKVMEPVIRDPGE
jgi:uncharacterized protein